MKYNNFTYNNFQSKICILLDDTFSLPFSGGLQIHAYELAESLVSKGYAILVISRQKEGVPNNLKKVGNLTVESIPPKVSLQGKGGKAIVPMLVYLLRILCLLVKYSDRYDFVLVSGYKMLSIPAIIATLLRNKKCIIRIEVPTELNETISSESLKQMNVFLSILLIKLLSTIRNKLIKRVDSFVAVSNEIRKKLINSGFTQNKIYCIPNGINVEKYSPVTNHKKSKLRRKLSLPANETIFTFTGNLRISKGLPLLIEIWKTLVQKFKDIHLLIVGSGEGCVDNFEDKLKEYIKVYNLQETVSLTGFVENVNEYLQASDIFVFPSEYESFGLSIIEALACGIPAIITKVGVANEVISNYENGILVNPKDKVAFEAAICWLLDNKNHWRSMGINARISIIERYSIVEVAERYCEMFAELIEK